MKEREESGGLLRFCPEYLKGEKWPFPETENSFLTGRSGVKCEIPVRYASGNVA